jgi:lipopolysaccharide/colanic/teichoic acid biosynthesis glycosyltransferase
MTQRLRLIAALGVLGVVLGARAIHIRFRADGVTDALLPYVGLAALMSLVVLISGTPVTTNRLSRTITTSLGTSLVAVGVAAVAKLVFPDRLPRFVVIASGAGLFVWLLLTGMAALVVTRRHGLIERVVAIVDADDATELRNDAEHQRRHEMPFILVEVIDDLHSTAVLDACRRTQATLLVLSQRASIDPLLVDQAETLHRSGVKVRLLEDFYDEWLGKLPVSSLDRFALMGDIESVHGTYSSLKRGIDLVCAAVGVVAVVAILPFILLGNLLANRGPLFFRQERVGKDDVEFSILKFRSMAVGAIDVSGWTAENDPRITPFGRLLRKTHIDELPQVFNVFAGQLSIVGPRPEQVRYVRELEQKLPFYSARHLVTPGLTGWAQVKYRYAASEEDAYVKLQYDLYYLRHQSLSTDLRIMWMTARQLLLGGGR